MIILLHHALLTPCSILEFHFIIGCSVSIALTSSAWLNIQSTALSRLLLYITKSSGGIICVHGIDQPLLVVLQLLVT